MIASNQYKKMIVLVAISFVISAFNISSYACSSFAYYGDKVYYGMNWDYYPNYDATFYISEVNNMKVFTVFDQDGADFTGMNTEGFFAAQIMVTPTEKFGVLRELQNKTLKRIQMKDLYRESLYKYSKLEQVDDYLRDKRLLYSTTELHTMFADKFGFAQVIEVGEHENMITKLKDKFLIMSNFTNYYFEDTDYKKIAARGSDRYIAGYDYMLKNIDNFDLNKGIGMLEAMKCDDMSFHTLCSFLYEPATNSVYIAISRDFSKVWRLSINNGTIETYRGFDEPMKIAVDSIRLSDLKKLSVHDSEKNTEKNVISLALLVLVYTILIVYFFKILRFLTKKDC